jgi:hypothetical protein
LETEQTQKLECKEITTPLHCCLIRAHAHSAGSFINYFYMQERAKREEL